MVLCSPALAQVTDCSGKPIVLRVLHTGKITWDGIPVTQREMQHRIALAAHQQPTPKIRVTGDETAKFNDIAVVFNAMQANSYQCWVVGFITK
jgi:biopolymer transport protein ExbD